MGGSSKKRNKKNKGASGGCRGKWSQSSSTKEHPSQADDDRDVLAEELTALAAIFQEDFKIISELPHVRFEIHVRPYYNESGVGDLQVSANLVVRCLPGYPHKCPKLQIVPEGGLSKTDADRLLSMLLDQANLYAREGRVMIFNLVEAAQEFLSEIPPVDHVNHHGSNSSVQKDEMPGADVSFQVGKASYSGFSSVCSLIDLYSDLSSDTRTWAGHDTKTENESAKKINVFQDTHSGAMKENLFPEKSSHPATVENNAVVTALDKRKLILAANSNIIAEAVKKINFVQKEGNNNIATESVDGSERSYSSAQYHIEDAKGDWDPDDPSLEEGSSMSSYGSGHSDNELQKRKDLILVHLLRLASDLKGPFSDTLAAISSELYDIGVLSEWARDLVAAPSSVFTKAFDYNFRHQMASSLCSQFWKPDGGFTGDNASARTSSRYLNDFEEVRALGHGGFGHVALCKNKLDGRQYAVKRIRLKDKDPHVNDRILREVATLSRLQHQHVVRYYQAWVETGYNICNVSSSHGSRVAGYSTFSYENDSMSDVPAGNEQESTYLYIQMEYCPRTLRQDFESYNSSFNVDYAWRLFRQIVEGLTHVHGQGIIHRDLTPSNIFFDMRNDIKIGDFGLAKFLKLEPLDHDQYFPNDGTQVSLEGTGQVGTYFYTAPEIEQSWPQINEKVDMYSLGVIFFELWHPFATAMERHKVLTDLKQKGAPPAPWSTKFPNQANLLQRLLSPKPSERPSAVELLQNEMPPRMEDEWLNEMLRMIQTPENTYVYDRIISAIFNEGRVTVKSQQQIEGKTKSMKKSSFAQSSKLERGLKAIAEIAKEVFTQHCAKRFETSPLRISDGYHTQNSKKTVMLLTQGGNMLELTHELRTSFVASVIANQISSLKRYEISWVYRRSVGHSTPSRFLQGDFDIVGGGSSTLAEVEVLKVAVDVATRFYHPNAIDVRLNHGILLESIWSWVGIPSELRQSVAELLSMICPLCPHSASRKLNWRFIRRQLLQDLHLSEASVDKLQTADLRFCGSGDQALARLRGALSSDKSVCKALDDLSVLINYLRLWSIEKQISIDVLMPPTEVHYNGLFFQVYVKESNLGSSSEAMLLAIGGRYDLLLSRNWDPEYKCNPPGAVGASIALEKILGHLSTATITPRSESSIEVLVCSRGAGGLLQERMKLVEELWQANIKAEFVAQLDPSLKEEYEYAKERDIKCLVIISAPTLSQTDVVKVRNLDLGKEKEVQREEIVRFLSEAISTQFRNPATWI